MEGRDSRALQPLQAGLPGGGGADLRGRQALSQTDASGMVEDQGGRAGAVPAWIEACETLEYFSVGHLHLNVNNNQFFH